MKLPHIAWPYQLGEVVEQDSFAQQQADAGLILCTPRGERQDVPDFGVTQPLFETVPVDTETLAAELIQSDPSLGAAISDVTELIDATVARLNIDLTAESQ